MHIEPSADVIVPTMAKILSAESEAEKAQVTPPTSYIGNAS